jgi:hypothetical protein
MTYLHLANLVAVLHGCLIVCVITGALAATSGLLHRRRRLVILFYSVIAALIASDVFIGECVLTRWERRLRDLQSPGAAYQGSYIHHYFSCLPPLVHSFGGPALVVASILAFPLWRWADTRRAMLKYKPTQE